jgi:hypothetical protein
VEGHGSTTRASLAAGRPARAHGTRPPTLLARDPLPRACLCRPLPLHARAAEAAVAEAKAVRDLELHAAAARAASGAHQRCRGRLERGRLMASLDGAIYWIALSRGLFRVGAVPPGVPRRL